jgi:hypothetical protein
LIFSIVRGKEIGEVRLDNCGRMAYPVCDSFHSLGSPIIDQILIVIDFALSKCGGVALRHVFELGALVCLVNSAVDLFRSLDVVGRSQQAVLVLALASSGFGTSGLVGLLSRTRLFFRERTLISSIDRLGCLAIDCRLH